MSSKRLRTNEDIEDNEDYDYDKCSFSHRICDDLCEVILEWLPIEDKLKFTEVSKQFRRCLTNVWNRQKTLKVNWYSNDRNNYKNLLKVVSNQCEYDCRLNIKVNRLAKVLQSFQNLNKICFAVNIKNRNQVLHQIVEQTNALKTFKFEFNGCSSKLLRRFRTKFGQSLHRLVNNSSKFKAKVFDEQLLKCCPNLVSLTGIGILDLIQNKEVLTKSLLKLNDFVVHSENHELLDLLSNCCPNLNHLSVELFQISDPFLRTQMIEKFSKFRELTVLSIGSYDCDLYDYDLAQSFQSIASNCKKLERFEFEVRNIELFNTKHCFESFKPLKTLKRLTFSTHYYSDVNTIHLASEELDLNCLKDFKLLKHLDIYCQRINDQLFEGIDAMVPQLRHLSVETNDEITDKGLEAIAKLKELKFIQFDRFDKDQTFSDITDLGLISLITNCLYLSQIVFWTKSNVSVKTITALIAKSVQNPRINFIHTLKGFKTNDLKQIFDQSLYPLNNIAINGIKK